MMPSTRGAYAKDGFETILPVYAFEEQKPLKELHWTPICLWTARQAKQGLLELPEGYKKFYREFGCDVQVFATYTFLYIYSSIHKKTISYQNLYIPLYLIVIYRTKIKRRKKEDERNRRNKRDINSARKDHAEHRPR